ncbi:MAG: hypothetical protein U1C97_00170, partial [Candidatus Gracilibacteria bacterium]|nr:hypothetical protein [Candidatus Gracilibacteria bacterium]
KQVSAESRVAFLKFYQGLHDKEVSGGLPSIKTRYSKEYKAEGGVYYMLLKFLHYLKDKFWKLKERKMDLVVEKIQDKTVEFVDEYYEEKKSYYFTLQSLSSKDLKRTLMALVITILISGSLVIRGSQGQGIVGPILLSFVKQPVSEQIWVNQREGRGYYEDMVISYSFLPNFLKYLAIGADTVFHSFFRGYYALYPIYLDFLARYYSAYFSLFIAGFWWGTAGRDGREFS